MNTIQNLRKDNDGNILINDVYHILRSVNSFNEDLIGDDLRSKGFKLTYNSKNFACDEFIKDHKGKHIVFSGCSNTFGWEMSNNQTWAYKTYERISKEVECSGYFNLAQPGAGIIEIVINLFRYFKLYGNPDFIFLNLPEQPRTLNYVDLNFEGNDITGYVRRFYDNKDFENTILLNYHYYFMLNQYCDANSIKLYSFSWHSAPIGDEDYSSIDLNKLFNKKLASAEITTNNIFSVYNFKTFYPYEIEKVVEHIGVIEKTFTNNKEEFLFLKDGVHFGEGFHIAWSNFIFNKYKADNK